MSIGDRIGKQIADYANQSSQGKCLEYVRKGIQRANNKPETATGINSAKDAGPWLENQGYKITYSKVYQNGDVMIISQNQKYKHGHIQVYYNGKWYSDFKQKTANPWVNCQVKAVYRIK